MSDPQPQLDDIDAMIGLLQRLAAVREHRHVLGPFKGYVGGGRDQARDSVSAIETFLIERARALARTIATSLPKKRAYAGAGVARDIIGPLRPGMLDSLIADFARQRGAWFIRDGPWCIDRDALLAFPAVPLQRS